MGELFAKSSPTPLQKLSNKIFKRKFPTHGQTVGASQRLAFATANDQVAKRRERNE